MRSFWVGLVVAAVLLTGLSALRSQAGNRKVPADVKTPVEALPDRMGGIFTGYGVDAAKAVEQAQAQAQERVRAILAEELGTGFRPLGILEPGHLKRMGVIHDVGEPVSLTLKDGDWFVAKIHVTVTRPYLQEAARYARQQHTSDRHLIAARVLAGLVALLLVVTGYLRLEDLTRGYATTMLRAAAVGVLLVVGLGLWVTA